VPLKEQKGSFVFVSNSDNMSNSSSNSKKSRQKYLQPTHILDEDAELRTPAKPEVKEKEKRRKNMVSPWDR